ncbi:hypothetical protein HQ585_17700 [candidate division KSB1 bacterium]|nr:hypothetical protein [candidate division KSB1 bacterium]
MISQITDTFATWQDNLRFLRIRRKYKITPQGGRTLLTLLFTPDHPVPSSIVHKLCALNGFSIISNQNRKYDLVFRYRDATFYDKSVEGVPDDAPMINRNATDISKKNVDRIFSEVFGYSLILDPTTHRGKAVEKSDANAQHDGRVIQCPIPESSIHPDCVYQRIINNSVWDNQVRDLRVVVHGDQIPLVYQKYRPVKTRFSNTNTHVELGEPSNLFSEDELEKTCQFAKVLGLDYGELDVLRDKDSGLIYIVDANLTPWGPPNGLSFSDQKKALVKLILSFRGLIEQHIN